MACRSNPTFHLATFLHRNAKGQRLNFTNREWLAYIYCDEADRMVIRKSARIGISEFLYIRNIVRAMQGLNGMYILPTEPIRNRVVTSRLDPILRLNKFYRTAPVNPGKLADSSSVKSIFGSMWNYVGSNSEATFHEFDADILIYDEYDKCTLSNLLIAEQRTGAAAKDRFIMVGNPTIAGFGIDARFEDSSKQFWMLKCTHCSKSQILDWWKHFIDRDDSGHYFLRDTECQGETGRDASAICQFCFKPIDRLGKGEWVAEHPGNPIVGYHCDKLFGRPGNDTAEERPIIREMFSKWNKGQSNQTALEIFYNQELGLPYTA